MYKQLSVAGFLVLGACASDPIDPLDPNTDLERDRVPQCPIGFHIEQSTSIIIKSDEDDEDKGRTQTEYKCVPDK